MLSTDKAWKKWGAWNPYFAVLADEKFDAANIDCNREEFFESGRASVLDILDRFERRFGKLRRNRALDHGCGVGRLTLPLAEEFSEVVGLDISPAMLVEARSNAEAFGLGNVRFELADDLLTLADGEFDFVNSYIVLQHIPVRRGLPIIGRLIDLARPGGGFHVHFSLRFDSRVRRFIWWTSHHIPGVKAVQNISWGLPWNTPAMQMNNYPLNRVVEILAARGIGEFFVSIEPQGKFLTCSLMGKKPNGCRAVT